MAVNELNRRRAAGMGVSTAIVAGLVWASGLASWRAAAAGAATRHAGQQPPPPAPPGGQGAAQGRGGGGGGGIQNLAFEDRTGFESMFDGKSLTPGADAQAAAAKEREAAAAARRLQVNQQPDEAAGGAADRRSRCSRTGTATRSSGASRTA